MPAGGYRYIPGVFQYSAGVGALQGFQIERVTLQTPVPLTDGFAFIERYLNEQGVPLVAFCACELRSPAPFTEPASSASTGTIAARWSGGAS